MSLQTITPREYYEGYENRMDREALKEAVGERYHLRVLPETPVYFYGLWLNDQRWIQDMLEVSRPVELPCVLESLFKSPVLMYKGDYAWHITATFTSPDRQYTLRVKSYISESGRVFMLSEDRTLGYFVGGVEEEEPETDPSLDKTKPRPLVTA